MFNILALIIISAFIPTIIIGGAKFYNYTNYQKLIKVFTITIFAVDLFRFFFNASLYNNGTTYAPDLKFSYLAVYVIMMMFATFNNGKLGEFFKKAIVFTSLMPLVLGLFNPTIYTAALDTHSIIKACYFVECGLAVTLAILMYTKSNITINKLDIVWGILIACGYVLINFLSITFWNTTTQINLIWYLQMLTCLLSVGVVYLVHFLIKRFSKQK